MFLYRRLKKVLFFVSYLSFTFSSYLHFFFFFNLKYVLLLLQQVLIPERIIIGFDQVCSHVKIYLNYSMRITFRFFPYFFNNFPFFISPNLLKKFYFALGHSSYATHCVLWSQNHFTLSTMVCSNFENAGLLLFDIFFIETQKSGGILV